MREGRTAGTPFGYVALTKKCDVYFASDDRI